MFSNDNYEHCNHIDEIMEQSFTDIRNGDNTQFVNVDNPFFRMTNQDNLSVIKDDFKEITEQEQTMSFFSSELTLSKVLGIDFHEIPHYLARTNPSFQMTIESTLPTTKNLERFRSLALLMHKIMSLEMIHSLWLAYQKSGLGHLAATSEINGLNKKIWPKEILSLVKQYSMKETTNKDDLCLRLVDGCLLQMKKENAAYLRELSLQSSCLADYTLRIEDIIDKFVQRGLRCLRIEIDCQIALVQYHYTDGLLQRHLLTQKPTLTHKQWIRYLCKLKYDQEMTRHKFHLLQEKVSCHLSAHPFDSQSIAQSPLMNSLKVPNLQLQLYLEYKTVLEQTKNNTLSAYIKSVEEQTYLYQQRFTIEMNEMCKMNETLPSHRQLTSTMTNLINQRLTNITACIESIFKFKRELFHVQLI